MRHHDPSRPFLSVIAWPDAGRARGLELLAAATGLTAADLRVRLPQDPPFSMEQTSPEAAVQALAWLSAEGGDGFAPTFDDLAALGPALPVKDLGIRDGVIAVELWNGMTTSIRREDVEILIRAHLSSKERRTAGEGVGRTIRASPGMHMLGGAPLAMGAALAFESAYAAASETIHARLVTSDKLDVHTRQGDLYRIDGDRFGFRVLGQLRGHGDKHNMDQLCELLSHVAPNEVVDPFFSLWRPPHGHQHLEVALARGARRTDPAFEFYSRWAALLYRHLLR